MRALLIFAYFRYAQAAKILARISSPYIGNCTRHRGLRSAPSAGFGDPAEGIAGAANKGFAASAALALAGPGARQKRPDRSRQARRGLRAISGQSHAKRRVVRCGLFCQPRAALLLGTRVLVSKRCFAPPRTGCRFGNARRFGRSGRSGRFGGSCDFAGLAGSAS